MSENNGAVPALRTAGLEETQQSAFHRSHRSQRLGVCWRRTVCLSLPCTVCQALSCSNPLETPPCSRQQATDSINTLNLAGLEIHSEPWVSAQACTCLHTFPSQRTAPWHDNSWFLAQANGTYVVNK